MHRVSSQRIVPATQVEGVVTAWYKVIYVKKIQIKVSIPKNKPSDFIVVTTPIAVVEIVSVLIGNNVVEDADRHSGQHCPSTIIGSVPSRHVLQAWSTHRT